METDEDDMLLAQLTEIAELSKTIDPDSIPHYSFLVKRVVTAQWLILHNINTRSSSTDQQKESCVAYVETGTNS